MLPCLELLRPSRPLTDQSWRPSCQADRCNVAPCNHYCSSGAISEHSLHYRALLVEAVFDNGFFVGPLCVLHTIYNNFCDAEVSVLADLRAPCTLFITTYANVKNLEVSFLADLRVSCTLFTTIHGNVNYPEVSFLNRPPCVLHIICNNLCDSEVRPSRDFIILNKSRTQPPRHEEDIGLRILVRFPSQVRA